MMTDLWSQICGISKFRLYLPHHIGAAWLTPKDGLATNFDLALFLPKRSYNFL